MIHTYDRSASLAFFGYREEDIMMLTDDQSDPHAIPTKENVVRAIFTSLTPRFTTKVDTFLIGDSLTFHACSCVGWSCSLKTPSQATCFSSIVRSSHYPISFYFFSIVYSLSSNFIHEKIRDMATRRGIPTGTRSMGMMNVCPPFLTPPTKYTILPSPSFPRNTCC